MALEVESLKSIAVALVRVSGGICSWQMTPQLRECAKRDHVARQEARKAGMVSMVFL